MSDCTPLRIVLSMNVQYGYSRETLRGIIDASTAFQYFGLVSTNRRVGGRQWRFQLFTGIGDPKGWHQQREIQAIAPHGIIYENRQLKDSENRDRTLRNLLERIPGPKVELYPFGTRPKWTAISSDDVAVGHMAAEHFEGLGLRSFAFFGHHYHEYSRLRRAGFENALNSSALQDSRRSKSPVRVPYYDRGKKNWTAGLRAWIGALQLPVGIFAANDFFATELLEELAQTGWKIPEEIAVLGVDDDDLLCNLGCPRLSSVVPGFRQVGRAAVGVLAELLAGSDAVPRETLILPLRIVTRQSTDILHVPDAQVAGAVKYIRNHSLENLSVKELIQKVPGNRRRLEKKFFSLIGRTPMAEIHRVRIARAKILLMEGKSVEQVAYEMHFSSAKYFATLFHRITGLTPSEFKLLDYHAIIRKTPPVMTTIRPGKKRTDLDSVGK